MWARLLAAAILAAVAWRDAAARTIPNCLAALLVLCGAANVIWGASWQDALLGLLVCGLPVLILAVTIKTGSIGGGDVKLCAALGFLLGPLDGCLVIALALLELSVYGLARRRTGHPLPFAPFVFPAYLAVAFLL